MGVEVMVTVGGGTVEKENVTCKVAVRAVTYFEQ